MVCQQIIWFFCLFILYMNEVLGDKMGVAYSPLVRVGDDHGTQDYDKNMVKTMLKVIADGGFNAVTTYGVGAPNKPFDNLTLSQCASIVHTAIATAEINKERDSLALTLYQGMYHHDSEIQLRCEIEVGLRIASDANAVYNGSVSALIYPSVTELYRVIEQDAIIKTISNLSKRVRLRMKLKYGIRLTDCQNLETEVLWPKIKSLLMLVDFLICFVSPDSSRFKGGYSNFKNYATLMVLQVEDFLKNTVKYSNEIELILETGWPGAPDLKSPNSVEDEKSFWRAIEDWRNSTGRTVFLHEAFDSPWKAGNPLWSLGEHFGRWRYDPSQLNLSSANAYILKKTTSSGPQVFDFGWTLGGIIFGVLTLLVISMGMATLYQKFQKLSKITSTISVLTEHDDLTFLHGTNDKSKDYDYGSDYVWENVPYNNQLELKRDQLKIDKTSAGLLGKGQFGCVYKAELELNRDESEVVAVKTIRSSTCSQTELKSLLLEIKTLAFIGKHEHVCNILGAYTKERKKGIVYLALELCHLGSLEQYLRRNKEKFTQDLMGESEQSVYVSNQFGLESIPMSVTQMLTWSREIAAGLEFISSKNIIHSDIACRNILLTAEYRSKITDFGLSRIVLEKDALYTKSGSEALPFKWLAPESLSASRQFSTKSDIFSYGVCVWEMFSIGDVPTYDGVHGWNDLAEALQRGERLKKPEFASEEIYSILLQCWSLDPNARPDFPRIVAKLADIISEEYLSLNE